MTTRRTFLQTTAAALAATPWLSSAEEKEAPPARQIIDTHTHFYDPSRPEGVPWPGKGSDPLYRTVLPKHFKEIAAPLGVTGTVVVEASPWLEDNQWILDLMEKNPILLGLVGNLEPGGKDFAKHLLRFTKDKYFRGLRISNTLVQQRLDDKQFLKDLALIAEQDRQLDVNGGPDTPADVARLAERVPELRIVINHEGNVAIDGKAPPENWLEGMQAAAAHPHVFCKVSALAEGAARDGKKAPTDTEFYKPILDAVWERFGEDRLIFGSNWPVSERAAPYAAILKIVDEYFSGHGKEAAEKYFSKNAAVAYKYVKR